MTDREAILSLMDGESYTVPESEKAFRKDSVYEMIKTYEKWT